MEAILIADLHLGLNTDSYYIKGQGNSRLIEQQIILNDIIQYSIVNDIKKIIVAGDIYQTSSPAPVYEKAFNEFLANCIVNKIYVDILEGNHDFNITGYGALDPIMPLFSNSEYIYIIKDPEVYKGILYMPHYNISKAEEYYNKCSIFAERCNPKIAIGHFHAAGSVMGYERHLLSNGELTINSFPEGITHSFLGHIHKPQEFNCSGVKSVYIGSLIKNDISEREEEKSFIVLDTENPDDYKRVKTNCTGYEVISVDEKDIPQLKIKDKTAIVDLTINNYKGVYTKPQIEDMISETNLIKAIKLNTSDKKEKVKSIDEEYKSLSHIDKIKQHFKEDKVRNKALEIFQGVN